MLNSMLSDIFNPAAQDAPGEIRCMHYYFHDIRITCYTNHSALATLLESVLGIFPQPETVVGEASYYLLCYDQAGDFPFQLPAQRRRLETLRLLTNTTVKYYTDIEGKIAYHVYKPQAEVNAPVLNVLFPQQQAALTQIEAPERYTGTFLRRYVLLMALGELMRSYGFEPCHAAAVTAPWDDQQGVLIIGASGSGKTSLSLGCACDGYGLLGDDLLMLRLHPAEQRLYAYALTTEVSVRPATLDLWPALAFLKIYPTDERDKRYCTIEHIHTGATRLQTPISLLIFPTLQEDGPSTYTPLSKAAALQELLEQCMGNNGVDRRHHQQLFSLLATVAEQAQGYRFAIARSDTTGPQLLRLLFTGR